MKFQRSIKKIISSTQIINFPTQIQNEKTKKTKNTAYPPNEFEIVSQKQPQEDQKTGNCRIGNQNQ